MTVLIFISQENVYLNVHQDSLEVLVKLFVKLKSQLNNVKYVIVKNVLKEISTNVEDVTKLITYLITNVNMFVYMVLIQQ